VTAAAREGAARLRAKARRPRAAAAELLATLLAALLAAAGAAAPAAVAEPVRPILRLDLDQHATAIQRIAASADGSIVATGGADGAVRLWSAEGEPLGRVFLPLGDGRAGQVTALAVSRSGRTALAAAKPPDAAAEAEASRLYFITLDANDAAGRRIVHYIDVAHEVDGLERRIGGAVEHVAMSPEGDFFGLAAGPWGWQVWSTQAGLVDRAISPQDPVSWIEFAPSGVFALAFASGAVEFRRIEDGGSAPIARFEGAQPDPASLAFSPDGRELAIGYFTAPQVDVLDLRRLEIDRRLVLPGVQGAGNLASVAWAGEAGEAGWLYAGGTARGPGDRPALAAWRGGRDAPALVEPVRDSVVQIAPAPDGAALFAAADPAWGRLRASAPAPDPRETIGRPVEAEGTERAAETALEAPLVKGPSTLDLRRAGLGGFAVSADGSRIWVRPGEDEPSLVFDLAALELRDGAAEPPEAGRVASGLTAGGAGIGLEARVQPGGRALVVNGREAVGAEGEPLLAPWERIRSLDVGRGPGGEPLAVVGTDYHLLTVGSDGRETARRPVRAAVWAALLAAEAPVVATALGDGVIRWWGLTAAGGLEPLAAAFPHPDRERWAAWTEDGFFAHADLGGTDLIGWRLNGATPTDPGRWFGFETLYHALYRPDLVASALREPERWAEIASRSRLDRILGESAALGARVEAYCPLALSGGRKRGLRALPPAEAGAVRSGPAAGAFCHPVTEVTIGAAVGVEGLGEAVPPQTRTVELVVDLGAAATGAKTIDVMANGRNVGRHEVPAGLASGRVALSAPVGDGLNHVTLRLHRGNGTFQSTPRLFFRRDAAAAEIETPRTLRLLGVGIDAYSEAIGPLRRAAADATDVLQAVHARTEGLWDAAPAPTMLTDAQATRGGVLAALDALAGKAGPQDAAVVYLAGHAVASLEDGYAFVTADVTGPGEISEKALDADALTRALARIDGQVLVVLDTCYAGEFRLEAPSRLAHDAGRLTFAASTSYQEALDDPEGLDNGLFAHAAIEGLRGRAALDGVVDALTLGEFLRREVEALAEAHGHDQKAVLRASSGELRAFPLAGPEVQAAQ
jgi:hypothetical protein